jgi:hypothetical protein
LLFFGANINGSSHDKYQGRDDGTDLATPNLRRDNKMETVQNSAA